MTEPTTDRTAGPGPAVPYTASGDTRRTTPGDLAEETGPDPWAGIPIALVDGACGYDTDTAGGCG